MNSAEKALQAKNREREMRIEETFKQAEENLALYERFKACLFWDIESLADKIRFKKKETEAKNGLKNAIKLYEKCAKEGHVESMERLAYIYSEQTYDQKKSSYWHQQAAEHGSIESMEYLADCYENGYFGFVQSEATAQKWKERIQKRLEEAYKEAVDKYEECKKNFELYGEGELDAEKLKSDDRLLVDGAVKLLTMCAKYEHVKSMELLGQIYKECMHDKKETFHWYGEGAKHGSTLCMHTLGVFYRDGIGTDKDSYMAKKYFDMEKRANNKI